MIQFVQLLKSNPRVAQLTQMNIDDQLADMAARGATVEVIGDQFLLFCQGHELMVKVSDGKNAVQCTAKKAATFGLFPPT